MPVCFKKGLLYEPLTLKVPEMQKDEFANNDDLNEVAHDEPPHLDLHCLPSGLWILNMIKLGLKIFENLQTKILLSAFWQLKRFNL